MFKKAYTFDDIALVPKYSTILSRTNTILDTQYTKNIKVKNPLIPSNMDTVISFDLAEKVINQGGIPIYHRFCDIKTQIEFCNKFKDKCFISAGVKEEEYSNIKTLFNEGALGVCIDIAHGHSKTVIDLIKKIKQEFPLKQVIAGNICTSTAYRDLIDAGADAVKVGVGPGAACTTRIVTGFGVPQFSAIYNIAQYKETLSESIKIPIIADGGIRNSRDVALAIAAGANTVMIGNLFSKTLESGSKKYHVTDHNRKYLLTSLEEIYEKYNINYPIYSHYRGQASKNFQNEYFGKVKDNTVSEGIDFYTKCSGYVDELYKEINGGLRSALTYAGSDNINDFQKNAEFVEVTNNYMSESKPREKQ